MIQTNVTTNIESLTNILTEANLSETSSEMKNQLAKDGKCNGLKRKLQIIDLKTVLSAKSMAILPKIIPTNPKPPK